MLYHRILNLHNLLKNKSFYLFGPRATGKSHLIAQEFDNSPYLIVNLLRGELFLRLSTKPYELEGMINAAEDPSLVIIDEVQRIPELLNEVHRLIEERGIKFLLTGSSARTLKRANVNLLAGRAWRAELFPLTSFEIPDFNLEHYLLYGGLPAVYPSSNPIEELNAYVSTYLKEEIQIESLVRRIPAFSRFLKLSALTSGQILNHQELANDSGIPPSTIREYYHILEDTFLGFLVPGWTKTVKRKATSKAKFYYFDLGVKNNLTEIKHIERNTDAYGQAFEHFIALELRSYLSYRRKNEKLTYWKTTKGHEVNFLIGDDIAVEVKTCQQVNNKHLKALKYLKEEGIVKRFILISHDPIARVDGEIEIMPWRHFLDKLWADKIISHQ